MPDILRTIQLSKSISGKELVKNVNIHVKKGEIYGFLGPNGAGKTTVMKMITNLWKPTEGSVELFGEKLTPKSYEVLKRMGSIIWGIMLPEAWKMPLRCWSFRMRPRTP